MGYFIDLKKISVDEYKETLKTADLLPSRRILKDNIEANFEKLKKSGMEDLEELVKGLNSKLKLHKFSKVHLIDEDYLTILVREIKSCKKKPIKIRDIPEISKDTVARLEDLGIKHVSTLYERILTPEARAEFSSQAGIDIEEVLRLAKLTDLTRIRWVNDTFAYILYSAGYETAEELACADWVEVHEKVKKLNEERKIFKGHIGVHDMKLCVESARDLEYEIKF